MHCLSCPALIRAGVSHTTLDRLQAAANEIKLICTDVDGTLLTSMQELTEPVLAAITEANKKGIPVCCQALAGNTTLHACKRDAVQIWGMFIHCDAVSVLHSSLGFSLI